MGQLPTLVDDLVIDGSTGAGGNVLITGDGTSGILAINSAEEFDFSDLELIGGVAENGGGLAVDGGGTVDLTDVDFTGNAAEGTGGGGLYITGDSTVTVTGGTFAGNSADDDDLDGDVGSGGAIFLEDGTLTVDTATFDGNVAERAGGAIEVGDGDLTVIDSDFTSNSVADDADGDTDDAGPGNGGAIHVTTAGSTVDITGGTFEGNEAVEGGALWNNAGVTMTVAGSEFLDNIAEGDAADQGGGAIYNNGGTLDIDGVDDGMSGVLTALFSGNQATGISGSGGAIFSTGGTVTIDDADIELNSANRAGGGIEVVSGTMTLTNVSLFGNDVDGTVAGDANPGNGGGLHVTDDATVTLAGMSTVSGNVAANEGGGLWNSSTGTLILNGNVVVQGNTAEGNDDADGPKGGGGIYNDGGTLTIDGMDALVTITGNTATGDTGSGGGIYSAGGDVTITSAVISENEANRAGGGIEIVDGSLTTTDVDFDRNLVDSDDAAPGNGGAVHVSGDATTSFTGGLVENNRAAAEGGAFWNSSDGAMTIDGVVFEDNAALGEEADQGGGAIYNDGGTVTVMNARFLDNLATEGLGSGGAILSVGGTVSVTGSVFNANLANRAGGAIEIAPSDDDGEGDGDDDGDDGLEGVTLTVDSSRFTRNRATGGTDTDTDGDADGDTDTDGPGNGGAIHVSGGDSLTAIDSSYFALNVAATSAGAVWNSEGSGMRIDGSTFSTNRAEGGEVGEGGGAVYNTGDLDVAESVFFRNVANGESGSGGAIINPSGRLDISGSTLRQNSAERAGGGIEIGTGEVILDELLVVRNTAGISGDGAPGNGGAVHVTSDADTRITGGNYVFNRATNEGGALWNSADGDMTLTATSINTNTALGDDADSGGGGIYNDGGTLRLTDVFVANNVANGDSGSGGGLLTTDGVVLISNSNFFNNRASRAGGGIEAIDGDLRISGTGFRNNSTGDSPGNGGAYHATGEAFTVVTGGVAFGNEAGNQGGAFWTNTGGRLILNDVAQRRNSAANGGGAVWVNGGRLDVNGGAIIDNETGGVGGGVYNAGTAFFDDGVRVRSNVAGTSGGGLFAAEDSRSVIRDAVFAGNEPTDFGGPGTIRGGSGRETFDRDGDGEED